MESGAKSNAPIGPTSSTWQGPYDSIVDLTIAVNRIRQRPDQSTLDCLKALPAELLLEALLITDNFTVYSAR